jgi:hypothetical protein
MLSKIEKLSTHHAKKIQHVCQNSAPRDLSYLEKKDYILTMEIYDRMARVITGLTEQ